MGGTSYGPLKITLLRIAGLVWSGPSQIYVFAPLARSGGVSSSQRSARMRVCPLKPRFASIYQN